MPSELPATPKLTAKDAKHLLANLNKFSVSEQTNILRIVTELSSRKYSDECRHSLLTFSKAMMPEYMVGTHHKQLANLLEDMAYGRKDRVTVSIAPRFGKSQLTSIFFPAWFIGNFPDKKIMMVSHTSDLAVDFGRKVRNLVASPEYSKIFPDVTLAADSKSAGRWSTNLGGEYFAVGIGGAIAGRGAHLLVVDDPHNEQDILSGNFDVFERAYDWYAYGARTRLMPGGSVAVVACMVGTTKVLMGDGSEKRLDALNIGDEIATYDNGSVATSVVRNWQCSGSDNVWEIRTTCGIIVTANKRHPFLVERNGELTWVRLKNLKPKDALVSLKGVNAERDLNLPRGTAHRVYQCKRITGNILMHLIDRLGIMGNTKEPALNVVSMGATPPRTQQTCARNTVTVTTGLLGTSVSRLKASVTEGLNTAMALTKQVLTRYLPIRTESALYANGHQRTRTLGFTKKDSFALTTATTPGLLEDFYVTTATLPLGTGKHPGYCLNPLITYDVSRATIREIVPCGRELVYDIQVDRTENFIADGVVSHNTRWAENDLIGKLHEDMVRNPESDQWDVVEFPALLEKVDAAGSLPENERVVSLWPEQWDVKSLLRTKASMPSFQWSAQYMQEPTAAESAIIKREWWQEYIAADPPVCEYIIMSLDAAAEKNNRADFTALTTWGVFYRNDENGEKQAAIILLNSIKQRLEFPELKALAYAEYKEWEPDWFVVEKKSAGTALYQELRRSGLPVQEITPTRASGDKVARLNAVSDIFASGMVWYPVNRRWAEEVVDEVCGFPAMPHDDLVDSTVYALMRFRTGGFISLPSDRDMDEDDYWQPPRAAYY